MARMPDREILAEVEARVKDAVGYLDSTLVIQRERATKYYRGDAFGNEIDGRSQVVSRDVAQYIDTIMPSLMRIFASGDEVVRFEPETPDAEEAAKQATDYVNWIWNTQNEGFTNFHHWFKDGLLNKQGVLKIWWDETPERTREVYRGLNEAELQAIEADESLEVGEVTETVVMGLDGMSMPSFDVRVTKTNKMGRVRVEPVPPEEFLFGRRARSHTDADVLAHRGMRRRGDLIAAGYDKEQVDRLFTGDDGLLTSEKLTRFSDVDDAPQRQQPAEGAAQEVEVIEAYMYLDVNDDDEAEYVKVTYSGAELLDCEEVDDHPFALVSPILMPHRLVGMSMADQLEDIQLIKSTVLRQTLDNLYLQNMPQVGVVEGQVNLDDLLTRRPGGVVRMKSPAAVVPMPTTPLGQEPYTMLEWLDTAAEQRTGATRYNQGLDANTLNHTATGINLIQNAAAQRIELIARVYAETGVKRAFRLILRLVCAHQDHPKPIKMGGRWVEMDPRGWRDSMNISVSVGLGNGSRDQTVAYMMQLLQMDEKIIMMQGGAQGPLVTLGNVYAKLKKLGEAIGLRSIEPFYTDPTNAQAMPQQPKPDPKVMEVQAKAQLAQQEAQIKAQMAQVEMQARMALEQQQAQHKVEIERARAQNEMELAHWKAQQQAQLEVLKAHHDTQLEQTKIERSAETRAFTEAKAPVERMHEHVMQNMQHVAQVVEGLAHHTASLHEHATAPREMIRGPDGKVHSVKIGDHVRQVIRGADGKPQGLA